MHCRSRVDKCRARIYTENMTTAHNLASLKRRLAPGTVLEVTDHSKRPELIGSRRTITASRATQYEFTTPIAEGKHLSSWPKASQIEWIDGDTFAMPVGLFNTIATFHIIEECLGQ